MGHKGDDPDRVLDRRETKAETRIEIQHSQRSSSYPVPAFSSSLELV